MHELSIAMSVLEIVEEESIRRDVTVTGVRLRLGPLSGVIKEALQSAFEQARESTELKNCRLSIEDAPLIANCPTCGVARPVESVQHIVCSVCGTPTPDIVSGREMEVVGLEVQT
jgi:hydrogenase nickel incorporation protein HypA/HybF